MDRAKVDKIRNILNDNLIDAYFCTRAWEAWGVGTMSPDDFELVTEDEEIMEGIINETISALDGWVSVEDRLPKMHKTVNIKYNDGRYSNSWIQGDGTWVYNINRLITHWQPLPPKP